MSSTSDSRQEPEDLKNLSEDQMFALALDEFTESNLHRPSHARAVAAAEGVDTAVQSHYIKFRVAHLRKAQAQAQERAVDILKKERRSFNCPSCKTRLSNPCEKLVSLYHASRAPICPTCKNKVPLSAIMSEEEWASLLRRLGVQQPPRKAARSSAEKPRTCSCDKDFSDIQAWLSRGENRGRTYAIG